MENMSKKIILIVVLIMGRNSFAMVCDSRGQCDYRVDCDSIQGVKGNSFLCNGQSYTCSCNTCPAYASSLGPQNEVGCTDSESLCKKFICSTDKRIMEGQLADCEDEYAKNVADLKSKCEKNCTLSEKCKEDYDKQLKSLENEFQTAVERYNAGYEERMKDCIEEPIWKIPATYGVLAMFVGSWVIGLYNRISVGH